MINFSSQENQLLSPDLKYLRSKLGAMAVTILLAPWFWREITTYRKSVFTSGISWFAAIALSKSAPTIWMLFKGLLQDKSLVFSWYSCLDLQWEKNFKLWLKCGFCRKLLLYECNSDQLPTFFSFCHHFWVGLLLLCCCTNQKKGNWSHS